MSDTSNAFDDPGTREIFALIGLLITNFANFEACLAPALAVLLDDNGDQASVILGQVDSFAYKWSTVVGIAELQEPKSDMASVVLSVQADIKKVNSFRNMLAHSGNRVEIDEFWLIKNATTTKRGKPEALLLTSEVVGDHNSLLVDATRALHGQLVGIKLTGKTGLMLALRNKAGIPIEDQ